MDRYTLITFKKNLKNTRKHTQTRQHIHTHIHTLNFVDLLFVFFVFFLGGGPVYYFINYEKKKHIKKLFNIIRILFLNFKGLIKSLNKLNII